MDKSLFLETMRVIKSQMEFDSKASDALQKIFIDSQICLYPTYNVIGQLIKILEIMLNDTESKWINYYIYELDFGKTYKKGCVKDKKGNNINISTASKLYDYLVLNKK